MSPEALKRAEGKGEGLSSEAIKDLGVSSRLDVNDFRSLPRTGIDEANGGRSLIASRALGTDQFFQFFKLAPEEVKSILDAQRLKS